MTKIDIVAQKLANAEKKEIVTCPICGSIQTTKFLNSDRYNIPATFRACQDCELVYMSPLPKNEFFIWFYNGMYRSILEEKFNKSFNNNALLPEQISYASELHTFLRPHLNFKGKRQKLKVLDIGGSTGVVPIELNKLLKDTEIDLEIVVQDPSSNELKYASEHGCKVECGLFEDISFKNYGKFDIILLCQTIDHIYSLDETFNKIKSLMHEETFFFVDYVDFKFNCAKKGYKNSVKIDHIFNFSWKNFNLLLKKHHLYIIDTCVSADHHLRGFLLKYPKLSAKTNYSEQGDYSGWLTSK